MACGNPDTGSGTGGQARLERTSHLNFCWLLSSRWRRPAVSSTLSTCTTWPPCSCPWLYPSSYFSLLRPLRRPFFFSLPTPPPLTASVAKMAVFAARGLLSWETPIIARENISGSPTPSLAPDLSGATSTPTPVTHTPVYTKALAVFFALLAVIILSECIG